MKKKRKPIGNSKRFEVFKRDKFVCQYCGNYPPKVILEIDHIVAVSKGGDNEIDNLITSCFECNRGKAARDINIIPKSLKEKATEIKEIESQVLGYQKIIKERELRIEGEAFQILDYLGRLDNQKKAYKSEINSVKNFIKKIGFYEVMEAAEISFDKNYPSCIFKYFCGVCWAKIKQREIN
jgi:hypothetical protein